MKHTTELSVAGRSSAPEVDMYQVVIQSTGGGRGNYFNLDLVSDTLIQ